MSIDRSLRSAGGLAKHRNVLTRAERIAKLSEKNQFKSGESSPLGLVKVGNRKMVTAKASKKDKTAEGDAAAAAPAAGAKAAAPAAKGAKK